MPKFVGQKATIMMGGTKLWKAMAKHAASFGTLLAAAHWEISFEGAYEAHFQGLMVESRQRV
ncbi:hypothetical protein [Agrobacterium tumefaciens]|uniref:hypothetical protein n=1 Tax=Agrobacterium tumefaciens TaxID=358 RepID=UPI00157443A0|nr:hypothetical protein [Agrobacterium tumefaciens]WCJ61551.1 hypothetical protein G6M15_08835 [Agrobacterium tumefaciens]